MNSPTVSVVIPCYNGAPFLRETLKSALAQTVPPLEIIVVDDGSTDDSVAIGESFGSPVRVLRQSNQGESVARNVGIREARGDWIALLDADDLWSPEKTARQLEAVSQNPDCACVYSDFYLLVDGQRHDDVPRPDSHQCEDFPVRMLLEWCVLPSTCMIPRKLAVEVLFPEHTRDSEDILFFVELRRHGTFLHVRCPLVDYRRTARQQTQAHGHRLRSVESLFAFLNSRPELYTPQQEACIRSELAARIQAVHERAYWLRDTALARRARRLYSQILPGPPAPPLLRRMVLPAWIYWIRDRLLQRPGNTGSRVEGSSRASAN